MTELLNKSQTLAEMFRKKYCNECPSKLCDQTLSDLSSCASLLTCLGHEACKDVVLKISSDDYEPWTKDEMITMLKAGYTPEYVSLIKWIKIHNHYITTQSLDYSWLNGNTCALCHIYYKGWLEDEDQCKNCTLYHQMGITCNNEDHPYISFGNCKNLEPTMVEMIKQLTKLVVTHGVKK